MIQSLFGFGLYGLALSTFLGLVTMLAFYALDLYVTGLRGQRVAFLRSIVWFVLFLVTVLVLLLLLYLHSGDALHLQAVLSAILVLGIFPPVARLVWGLLVYNQEKAERGNLSWR